MEEKQTPSYYAIITADVRYDKKLSASEKILYAEITALCNANGMAWPSNGYFSNLYGVSKVTVSRWIKNLVDLGYIDSRLIRNKETQAIEKRVITINKNVNTPINKNVNTPINKNVNTPINKNVNTPINKNVNTPINKNVKENNTSINNTSINTTEIQTVEKSTQKKMLEYFNLSFDKNFPETMSGRFNSLVNSNISMQEFIDVVNYIAQKWSSDITDNLTPNTLGNSNKFDNYLDQAIGNGFKNTKKITAKKEKEVKIKIKTNRNEDYEKVKELYTNRYGFNKVPRILQLPDSENKEMWNLLLSNNDDAMMKLKGIVEND